MDQNEYKLLFHAEDTHWWFIAKRQFIRTFLPPPDGTLSILDLGAGTGATSKFLEKWGNVTRIESSQIACGFLRKRNLPFTQADITKFSFPREQFDLVMCFDVLYHKHITSDEKVLNAIYSALKPNGYLLITDCALPFMYSRHDVRNHARERYTRRILVDKVTRSGLTVTRVSYIYFFLFPLFLLSRFLGRFSDRSDVCIPHPIINTFFSHVCSVEAALLKYLSFPIGSSLILLARKKI